MYDNFVNMVYILAQTKAKTLTMSTAADNEYL